MNSNLAALDRDGFAVLHAVFSAKEVAAILLALDAAFAAGEAGVLRSAKAIYGARNLLTLWPGVAEAWRKPVLVDFVRAVLGAEAGLVRVLFFDKPPEQSWTLPWHRDLTIAIAEPVADFPTGFGKPTTKAGVPHVEAPVELLERMLTLRIHLDPMTADNGPLSLIPGSHRCPDGSMASPITPLGPAGDVLAMRPLASHGSRHSKPHAHQHRRVLHLEFAGLKTLPAPLRWRDFVEA